VGKGALAPCPPFVGQPRWWARFALPTLQIQFPTARSSAAMASRSRRASRASFADVPSPGDQRAQGMPGARCARSLVCEIKKHTSKSPRSRRIRPAFPAQWFYGLYRALPGDRACLPPSPRGMTSAKLDASVGASGPHDFAVREAKRVRQRAACVHRIPRSTSVTIAKRPSRGGGTAGDIVLIWVSGEAEYFLKWDWTAKITLIRLNKTAFWRKAPARQCRPDADSLTPIARTS
jgi:hypothetical protein